MNKLLFCALLTVLLANCRSFTPSGTRGLAKKTARAFDKSPVFAKAFTGFVLRDAETGSILVERHGNKLFTPASTTKIMTLYTCLKVLGDSLASIQYAEAGDTLFFRGTGDPTFLNRYFNAWQRGFDFLKTNKKVLVYENRPFPDPYFGPGWAWEDGGEAFQTERTAMPIYGNLLLAQRKMDGTCVVYPRQFAASLKASQAPLRKAFVRQIDGPSIYFNNTSDKSKADVEQELPIYRPFPPELLQDTLDRIVLVGAGQPERHWKTLFSTPVDTVYRRMMYQSDNHIAEQLLLQCAAQLMDTLSGIRAIDRAKGTFFLGLPQVPKWVDGSGLSRYNLNSPINLTLVLHWMWRDYPRQRVLSLFPTGGVSGTVKDWYKGADNKPFVFAKTGSMGAVQCLSGFVIAKSGRVLAFSFMNNHFTDKPALWKTEMQNMLQEVYRIW